MITTEAPRRVREADAGKGGADPGVVGHLSVGGQRRIELGAQQQGGAPSGQDRRGVFQAPADGTATSQDTTPDNAPWAPSGQVSTFSSRIASAVPRGSEVLPAPAPAVSPRLPRAGPGAARHREHRVPFRRIVGEPGYRRIERLGGLEGTVVAAAGRGFRPRRGRADDLDLDAPVASLAPGIRRDVPQAVLAVQLVEDAVVEFVELVEGRRRGRRSRRWRPRWRAGNARCGRTRSWRERVAEVDSSGWWCRRASHEVERLGKHQRGAGVLPIAEHRQGFPPLVVVHAVEKGGDRIVEAPSSPPASIS